MGKMSFYYIILALLIMTPIAGAVKYYQEHGSVSVVFLILVVIAVFFVVISLKGSLRSQYIISLFEAGNIDQFLAEVDKHLAIAKTDHMKNYCLLNKSAGYTRKGMWSEAVAALDDINLKKLNKVTRQVYINNMLHPLLFCDLPRAKQFYEEHKEVFQPGKSLQNFTEVMQTLEAALLLLTEKNLETEPVFRKALENKNIHPLAKAMNLYFLSLLEYEKGNKDAALKMYQQAKTTVSHNQLGPAPDEWPDQKGERHV